MRMSLARSFCLIGAALDAVAGGLATMPG